MKALILAAGYGKRLKPVTDECAKPAVWFFDRPVIAHLISQLKRAGVDDVFINLHHRPASVRRHVRQSRFDDVTLHYNYEPDILGTAGALAPLRSELSDEPFFIVNGDIVTDIDFKAIASYHNSSDWAATLVVHPPSLDLGFPPVGADQNGQLCSFPFGRYRGKQFIFGGTFTGIQVVNPSVFKHIRSSGFQSLTTQVYPYFDPAEMPIGIYEFKGYWNDIGSLNRYVNAHGDVLQNRLKSKDYIRTQESLSSGIFVHPSAEIGHHVRLEEPVVIGRNARIGNRVNLSRIVVWPGVTIEDNTNYSNGIVYDSGKFVLTLSNSDNSR
jgi:NDP-sugar pyrophosphorylase family protein